MRLGNGGLNHVSRRLRQLRMHRLRGRQAVALCDKWEMNFQRLFVVRQRARALFQRRTSAPYTALVSLSIVSQSDAPR
jgi:hypothetical protein